LQSAAREVFYYAANNRPCKEHEAIIKLELYDGEKKGRILEVYSRNKDEWNIQIRKEITPKGKNQLKITVYRDREVIEKYKRIYRADSAGCYTFTEKRKGVRIREGRTCRFLPLHLEGTLTKYHSNGNIQCIAEYRDNQLVSNKNWIFNGRRSIDNVFQSVDKAPRYIEGEDKMHAFVRSYVRGSTIPVADLDGTIRVGVVIMENGTIGAVDLLQGLREDMDGVVLRAIMNLPGLWEPAVLEDRNVRCSIVFPVHFHLAAKGPRTHKPELPGGVQFWL
jgi:hypothetical protein